MRAGLPFLSLILIPVLMDSSPARAQAPGIEVQAGLGYARVFDGGGISFAAALDRPLSSPTSPLHHAVGGSFWYAHTSIATAPDDPYGRHLVGVGLRYQLGLGRSGSIRPFLAVPIQILRSNIPDRTTLQGADLLITGIPDPGPPRPVEDVIGSEWGWGAGLELGLRLGVANRLSAQTSVHGLYQDIYGSDARHGAWSWHAGLIYQLGTR
jgi:hypothetical protein